jgi:hypothetical protein
MRVLSTWIEGDSGAGRAQMRGSGAAIWDVVEDIFRDRQRREGVEPTGIKGQVRDDVRRCSCVRPLSIALLRW